MCHILDGLAGCALEATGFSWKKYDYRPQSLTRCRVHVAYRPQYQDEPTPPSEVVGEEPSEVNLTQIEDQLEDDEPDSEDEAPVFLDLSTLRNKDSEVMWCGMWQVVTLPVPACRVTWGMGWEVLWRPLWTLRSGGWRWSGFCRL